MLTKLEAVNSILQNLGVSQVTSLEVSNTDVRAALGTIENFTVELQSTGWWFNTEYNVKLAPDILGYIFIPSNTLTLDTSERYGERIVTRGDRLYNIHQRTDKFTSSVEVNMILALKWDELPYMARNLVRYAAMYQVQSDYEGDTEKLAKVQEQVTGAYNALRREDLRQKDINQFQSAHVRRVLNRGTVSGRTGNYIGGRTPDGAMARILGA